MKKLIVVVMAIVLCLSLVGLTACGGDEEPAAAGEERQNVFSDGDEDVAGGGYDDDYYTGVVGDGSSIFMIGLSIGADGTQCMLAFGNPGDSVVVLGQLVDNDDGSASIYPLDGSDPVDFFLGDNGNGSISIEIFGFEGSMDPVSESEFMDLANSLS